MTVHFEPDLQAKLERMALESGRATGELIRDAVADFVDAQDMTRELLHSRYDDIQAGKVKLIPGDEVFARLREKSEARRANPSS